jgi:hypothetical protein
MRLPLSEMKLHSPVTAVAAKDLDHQPGVDVWETTYGLMVCKNK